MNVDEEGTTIRLVLGSLEQVLLTLIDIHPHQSNVLGVPSLQVLHKNRNIHTTS